MLKKIINNIIDHLKNLIFTLIFCCNSKKIKKSFFLYGNFASLSKLSLDIKNLRIHDENGNTENLISPILSNSEFILKTSKKKWKSPVNYPLKINTKDCPQLNKKIEPYNKNLHLNYGKHYNKKNVAENLNVDMDLAFNVSDEMARYAARKSLIKPFKKKIIKHENIQDIKLKSNLLDNQFSTITIPKKEYTKIPNVIHYKNRTWTKAEILNYYPKSQYDVIYNHYDLWKWEPYKAYIHKSKIFKFYTNKDWKDYDLYDIEEEYLKQLLFKSEDFVSWFEIWNPMGSYLTDQYLFAIPLLILFFHIHWILAEAILCKFKCQQHYWINSFFLNGWFLLFIYIYKTNNLSDSNKTGCFHGAIIESADWPIYFILYQWWFFLIISFFIVSIFLLLAPKSPFLRSKNIMKTQDYCFLFIPCVIGLLLPFIFAQKKLPFWQYVENMIFFFPK